MANGLYGAKNRYIFIMNAPSSLSALAPITLDAHLPNKHKNDTIVREVIDYQQHNEISAALYDEIQLRWGVGPTTAKRWLKQDGHRQKNGHKPLLTGFEEKVLFNVVDKLNNRGDPVDSKCFRELVRLHVTRTLLLFHEFIDRNSYVHE